MTSAWKSDLNRVLHVFNVCSATSVWPPLTVHSQTELSMNTHIVVTDIRQDVVNTRTIVSDIHRAIVVNQEGSSSKDRSVSATRILFIVESTLTTA